MKAYVDTNILVAAAVRQHPHYIQSFDLVKKVKDGTLQGCVSAHGLAEYYSVLTRAPFNPRVHPLEAERFLNDNILPYFDLIPLSAEDYKAVLTSCAKVGLIGAVVFDALHLQSAKKAACDRIYTFNLKDFRSLASAEQSDKIVAP